MEPDIGQLTARVERDTLILREVENEIRKVIIGQDYLIERLLVGLAREEAIGAFALPYLNRLSDLLFVACRSENHDKGVDDVTWDSRS